MCSGNDNELKYLLIISIRSIPSHHKSTNLHHPLECTCSVKLTNELLNPPRPTSPTLSASYSHIRAKQRQAHTTYSLRYMHVRVCVQLSEWIGHATKRDDEQRCHYYDLKRTNKYRNIVLLLWSTAHICYQQKGEGGRLFTLNMYVCMCVDKPYSTYELCIM